MTIFKIPHIAGSAFALTLTTATSPITIAGEPALDIATWGAELVIVGKSTRVVVPGFWILSAAPSWVLSFSQNNTSAWPEGTHDVRIAFASPEATPRRFEQTTNLQLEVSR